MTREPRDLPVGSQASLTALDVHTHAMPLPLLRWLADQSLAEPPDPARGVVVLDPRVSGVGPGTPIPLAPAQYAVDARLASMDRTGVTHHAVSLPPFLLCSRAEDAALARDVVRRGNDALRGYADAAPDRLLVLGAAPVGLPGAAEEARRCLDELGMAGVAIGSQGLGRELDDPVNEDLWAFLAGRRAFVFLHPSGVPDPQRMRDYWLPQLVGFPVETALAVARLIFGGVLERNDLRLCLAHGGGCLPILRGRLDLGWERKEAARTVRARPGAALDRLYYDTAVFSVPVLRRLVEDVGPGRVLLGTDTPFELADTDPRGTVRALGLPPSDTERILAGTAASLLDLTKPGR